MGLPPPFKEHLMDVSPHGVDLVKKFEGLRLEAYLDSATVWTIGYGHTGDVWPGSKLPDEATAAAVLLKDLNDVAHRISKVLTKEATQHQFDAMVSLAYNIGTHGFAHSSVVRFFNQGNLPMAAASFEKWTKCHINGKLCEVPGLAHRRASEKAYFLTPEIAASMVSAIKEDQDKSLYQSKTVWASLGTGLAVSSLGAYQAGLQHLDASALLHGEPSVIQTILGPIITGLLIFLRLRTSTPIRST